MKKVDNKEIVFNKIKELTKEKFDLNSKINDLGIDSLDFVTIITDIEDEYDISISDKFIESAKNIGDLVKEFERLTNES